MLDRDLARLYGVPAKRLNEQVKRNTNRFPVDFMFKLTSEEILIFQSGTLNSRPQFATLKQGQNIKYLRSNPTAHVSTSGEVKEKNRIQAIRLIL